MGYALGLRFLTCREVEMENTSFERPTDCQTWLQKESVLRLLDHRYTSWYVLELLRSLDTRPERRKKLS